MDFNENMTAEEILNFSMLKRKEYFEKTKKNLIDELNNQLFTVASNGRTKFVSTLYILDYNKMGLDNVQNIISEI